MNYENFMYALIALCLAVPFIHAGIIISPADINSVHMYGGESENFILTVKNNDSWNNTVHLVIAYRDINNISSGFETSLSENNFGLLGNQSKQVTLTLKALTNVAPGDYNFSIFADGSGYQPDSVKTGGGGGSGGGSYHKPDVNTNTDINTVPDNSCICTMQYDPVCGKDKITYGNSCVASCNNISIDYAGECIQIIIDSNKPIDINNVIDTNEPIIIDNTLDNKLFYIIILIVLSLILGYIIFKPVKKEETPLQD